jgi:hypothetical protein
MIMHDNLPIHTKSDSREILRGHQQDITGTASVCATTGQLNKASLGPSLIDYHRITFTSFVIFHSLPSYNLDHTGVIIT